jgi:hypothetical protein
MRATKQSLFREPVTGGAYSKKAVANAAVAEDRIRKLSKMFGIAPPRMELHKLPFPQASNTWKGAVSFSVPYLGIADKGTVNAVSAHEFIHYYKKDVKKFGATIYLAYALEAAAIIYSIATKSAGLAIGTIAAVNVFLAVFIGKIEARTDILASKIIGKGEYAAVLKKNNQFTGRSLKKFIGKLTLAGTVLLAPYAILLPFAIAIFEVFLRGKYEKEFDMITETPKA